MKEKKKYVELEVDRYTDGCDEVWGVFEPNSASALIEFPFWDDGDGVERKRIEEKARLFAAAPKMLYALGLAEKCLKLAASSLDERITAADEVMAAIKCATTGGITRGAGTEESKTSNSLTFGGCPVCLDRDGFLDRGKTKWFACLRHRTRWCVKEKIFRHWRGELPAPWNPTLGEFYDFTAVDPVYASSETLASSVSEAIKKVVKHFLPDEAADFEWADNAVKGNHIFHQLTELESWLERFAGGGDV